MQFVLFVEGHSEKKKAPAFLKRWLDQRLSQPVGIHPVLFDGWGKLIKDAPKKAEHWAMAPDTIAVIALLDLSGPEYPPNVLTVRERYNWLVADIKQRVVEPKFEVFPVVHELEAWLLSDPMIFPAPIRSAIDKIREPEAKNFNEPPKKFLKRLYETGPKKKKYKETVHTVDLLDKLDPEKACEKCPYLCSLLETMLKLAKNAIAG